MSRPEADGLGLRVAGTGSYLPGPALDQVEVRRFLRRYPDGLTVPSDHELDRTARDVLNYLETGCRYHRPQRPGFERPQAHRLGDQPADDDRSQSSRSNHHPGEEQAARAEGGSGNGYRSTCIRQEVKGAEADRGVKGIRPWELACSIGMQQNQPFILALLTRFLEHCDRPIDTEHFRAPRDPSATGAARPAAQVKNPQFSLLTLEVPVNDRVLGVVPET